MDSKLSPERRAALAIAAAAIIVAATALILPATSFTVSTVGTQDEAPERQATQSLNYTELSPLQQELVDEAIANESTTVGTGDPPLPRSFTVTKDGTTYVMDTSVTVEGQFILFATAIVLGAFAMFIWVSGADRDVGGENVSPAAKEKPWEYDIDDDPEERNGDGRG